MAKLFTFTTWKLVALGASLALVLAANGTLALVADKWLGNAAQAQEEKHTPPPLPDDIKAAPPEPEAPPLESRPPAQTQEFVEDPKEPRVASDFEIKGNANGIFWGTATLKDSAESGFIQYSVAEVGKSGYLHGDYQDERFPKADFANLTEKSSCGDAQPGYQGAKSLAELTDAGALEYKTTKSIWLGSKKSGCYQGLLVIRQAMPNTEGKHLYIVLDPLEVDNTSLKVRWWANLEDGTPDFSKAPADFK